MTGLDFVVLALAAWRLAHLLVKEAGPFDVFGRLRQRAGIRQVVGESANGPFVGYAANNALAKGLLCVWCVSVWTAALLTVGVLLPQVGCAVLWGARILAVSAGAILVQEFSSALRGEE